MYGNPFTGYGTYNDVPYMSGALPTHFKFSNNPYSRGNLYYKQATRGWAGRPHYSNHIYGHESSNRGDRIASFRGSDPHYTPWGQRQADNRTMANSSRHLGDYPVANGFARDCSGYEPGMYEDLTQQFPSDGPNRF